MEGAEVSTGAVIGGHCIIGPHARIGLNATLRPWVVVGRRARIGAGAVVTKDVPPGETRRDVGRQPGAEAAIFERARAYNAQHPEPTRFFDVTGYEYGLVRPGDEFSCYRCRRRCRGIIGVTGHVREAFDDPCAPTGRSQRLVGAACSSECAFG
jgi:hypothetical protein